jgi:Fic family protein
MKNILMEIDELQMEINKFKPLDEHLIKLIKDYYRIGLAYTSNALEGNSLTESETKVVIEEGLTIGGKPLKDHFEALGHSEAYDIIFQISKSKKIKESNIKEIHSLFYYRIDKKDAGQYRKIRTFISGSKYPLPLPERIPELMKKFMKDLIELRKKYHPVEFASLTHKDFVFIHPFIDGNGRVARLLMNLILLQEGYNIAMIPPIVRHEYISALEKAHINDKDFMMLIARMVKETQLDHLRLFIKNQNLKI